MAVGMLSFAGQHNRRLVDGEGVKRGVGSGRRWMQLLMTFFQFISFSGRDGLYFDIVWILD